MAKFAFATTHDNVTNTKGGFIMNFVRFILNFFKSIFCKEHTPSHREILNQEYETLYKENEILKEVRNLLRKGYPGWDDPYTYSRACDLIKQIARDASRYNGSEKLHDYAGGIFYFYDKDNQFHEVSYQQMSEEYRLLSKNNAIPRDWDKYVHGKCNYKYLGAMQVIQKNHLPMLNWHANVRFDKNKERMDAILEELYGAVPAEA